MSGGGTLDEKSLGKHLQAARRAAGLTQQTLCQRANLSYSTLAKIERGAIKTPSIFTVQSIAAALGTSLDALLGIAQSGGNTRHKQQSKSGVRFVYFDVNGCLVSSYHHAFTRLAADTDVPPDFIESAFWHYNDEVCRGTMTMHEFNVALSKRLQITGVDWTEYYLAAVQPIMLMQELVRWASQHYAIGLLTNIMPGLLGEMRTRRILPDVAYDAVIDSSRLATIKPERKIYEIAQEQANVAANEILLIDDTRANLMAAERLDWHVLWFDNYRAKESVDNIRKSLEFSA